MMNFLERVLRMPRVVVTVMVLLLVAGFGAYMSLPKESFPAIDIPYFYVSVSQTGVAPKDAERLLAKPIEDRLEDLDGLQNITSTSTTGHVSVFLEFDVNADKDKALADIRAKLDGVSAELPEEATEPSVTEISATSATMEPKLCCTASPWNRPSASGLPQPAFSAARSSTAWWRGWPSRRARRY